MTTVTTDTVLASRERDATRSAWEAIAAGYDEFVTPTHFWLGTEALRRAGLQPRMRFLDVAAGSGALSIPAARLGAEVLSTDLSPGMLQRLRARAKQEGLSDLETRVMDGHALELGDDAFDVAGSQYGIMLFPDLPRAVRELVRVTRPGGRVVLVVYGAPQHIEFLTFFLGALHAVVPGFTGLPDDPPPLPFQVADPAKLRQALSDAGLRDIRIETVTESLEFGSGEHMWSWVINSNPLARILTAGVTDEQAVEVRRVLDGMLRERSGGDGAAVLTNPVHIGIGVK